MISPDTALIALAAYAAGIATAVGGALLRGARQSTNGAPIPTDWVPRDLPPAKPVLPPVERRPSPYAPKSHTKPVPSPPKRETHWPAPPLPAPPATPPAALPSIDWGSIHEEISK
jgi:hypothetical protein